MPKRLLESLNYKKKLKVCSRSKFRKSDKKTSTENNKRPRFDFDTNLKLKTNMTEFGLETNNENSAESISDIKVDYLENPVKSENDTKEYRVIKLPNGLTALLISDLYDTNNIESGGKGCQDKEPVLSSNSSSEDEFEEIDDDDDGEEGNESADSNSTEDEDAEESSVLKSSIREEKMAACGLCIGVGSFSDPPEIPGLAHFLEHMVFMGSKKYPLENDFDAFIQKKGGSDNASTECEHTTFYFEIDEKYLLSALDRFAQFFISPLLLRDAMTREREAVESEFKMALTSDSHRKEQLFCSFVDPQHPASKFTWGNLRTLKENVTNDKLYMELHNFREHHYSAHRMTVAIQARLTLDTLENYVKKCFAYIPSNKLPSDDFSKFAGVKPFNTPIFTRIYKIKPIKDLCQIELTWAMPSMHHLYKSKPHQYVSWIIGHEGKGSLISYLRKKMWCLDIFSGNGESGFEHSSMYALFSLSMILTDEGHANLKQVLDAVFSYINMIKKIGPQIRIFNEIKKIEDTNFRFADDEQAADYVEEMCESMHFYPSKDYITGSELYWEYDPDSIIACLNILRPDNVNIIIFDKKFDDKIFDKVEPWFETKYTDTELPKEWIEDWKTIEPFKDFHLPEPNEFVTDDYTLISIEDQYKQHPVKIHEDILSEIWYKQDAKFRIPECFMNFLFISPLVINSAVGSSMIDMMAAILKQILVEEAYPATAAELNHLIQSHEKGLIIKVWGYNQKLPLLLQTIVKYISRCPELITENLFNIMKEEQLKAYYNTFLKPERLNKEVRLSIMIPTNKTSVEKHTAGSKVTFQQFITFCKTFNDQVYIKCLVQGNMLKNYVIENTLKAFDVLNCKPLSSNTMQEIRVFALPKGIKCCKVKNFNPIDSNSVVTNYYQSDLSTIKLSVTIELLMMFMEEPLFNQLRTQEQLGYNVSCRLRDTFGVMGYSVTVCTQAEKYTVEYIDNRIEEFFESFYKILEKTDESELDDLKSALIKLKKCADNHLREELARNWAEITSGEYMFDRHFREVEAIKKITLKEIKAWLKEHSIGGKNYKKLSVQIVGTCKGDVEQAEENYIDKKRGKEKINVEYTYEFSENLTQKDEEKITGYYITNIEDFKSGLKLLPVHFMNFNSKKDV